MVKICRIIISAVFILNCLNVDAEDGYRLWLRYDNITDVQVIKQYNSSISGILFEGKSSTIAVAKEELLAGLAGLLGKNIPAVSRVKGNGIIIAGTPENSEVIASLTSDLPKLRGRKKYESK